MAIGGIGGNLPPQGFGAPGAAGQQGGPGGPGGPGGQMKAVFQEAKQLAQSGNQQVAADLEQIHEAHQQARSGAGGGVSLSGGGQALQGMGGPGGISDEQRQQMHAQMAPLLQQLTTDVQAAQGGGATDAAATAGIQQQGAISG